MASFIQRFLEGVVDALVLYLKLNREEQQDADMIEIKFKQTVIEGALKACMKLTGVQ